MESSLLSCSICPKRPSFSDTSHLLTHISSKGHLSHLHKLQVRSHQEVAAGQQLAVYDRWCQQHDLGTLLSERLIQKESKKSGRRAASVKVVNNIDPSIARLSGNGVSQASPARRRPKISKPTRRQTGLDDDDSDYSSSPVRPKRRRSGRKRIFRPLKLSSPRNDLHSSDLDCPGEDDSQLAITTPDSSKLKGVIWPGMDLFDAATAEMKRRRNQKKDGSILKQMERTSEIVEPTEIIYSSGGTRLKERLIDGNFDNSSPLRGETPVPKPVTRKRRQPLISVDPNVPRAPARGVKVATSAKVSNHGNARGREAPPQRSTSFYPSPAPRGSRAASISRYSPTEDETMEFQLTVGNLRAKKRTTGLAVFEDNTNVHAAALPDRRGDRRQPLAAASNRLMSARPQLSFVTAPWLQPQNQQPHLSPYNSAYMSYNYASDYVQPQQHYGFVKSESHQYLPSFNAQLGAYHNPLDVGSLSYNGPAPFHQARSAGYMPFFGAANADDDVFGFPKNPLNAAFEQMHKVEHPSVPDSRDDQKENTNVVSPIRTASDHENEYEQTMFATSE